MAENFSVERRKMMRFLGARVVLTPASEKGSGMLRKAVELAEKHGWYLTRQFENEANADFHSLTTAVEILDDFEDIGLDYWVSGYGTGGTLKGVARVLKEKSPVTRVIACEPDNAQLLGSGLPQGDGSHPGFRPHLMQGWTPDFISKLTGDAQQYIDALMPINGQYAMDCARELATKEGIFTGISGGATMAGALTLASSAPAGSKILCMLPDTGERYLSTPLFEDVAVDMTEVELTLSRSTPGCRFDAPPPQDEKRDKAAAPVASVTPGDEDRAFVQSTLKGHSVVMFALEWCEFCWSVRKMFAACEIPYHSVDLDSVAYQEGNQGGRIRAALTEQTQMPTIPQIFVGGELIGGATEVFDAYNEGRLQSLLESNQVTFRQESGLDAYDFLPDWLQAR